MAWFPIAYDIAVLPGVASTLEMLVDVEVQIVQSINERIFRQSTEIAGPTQPLIEALVSAIDLAHQSWRKLEKLS